MPVAEYDAIIVGGGPAGLAAAIALATDGPDGPHGPVESTGAARDGFHAAPRVLLVERRESPVDKACGEGIMPAGIESLRDLGVAPTAIAAAGGRMFRGIRYTSPRGRVATADFREGPGLGLRRTALARLLLDRARFAPGLVIEQSMFRAFERSRDGRFFVHTTGHSFTTRLLVGADGLHSQVRRQAGLAGRPDRTRRWGMRRHFAIAPWSDHVEVAWERGLEAYVTPTGTNEVGLAFLWDARQIAPGPGLNLWESLLARFPALRRRLADARPLDEPKAAGPLAQNVRATHAEGIILIGDAAGYLDACTGEGLSLSFGQALALRRLVRPLLVPGGTEPVPVDSLRPFAEEQARLSAAYYRMTGAVLLLHRFPILQEGTTALFRAFPGLFQNLLSLNMGHSFQIKNPHLF